MYGIAQSNDPRWLAGNPPFGYVLDRLPASEGARHGKGYTNTLAVNDEAAAIVRRIFTEFLSGRSFREIAATFAEERILSPNGTEVWHLSTIHGILRNFNYTGYREYGKQRREYVSKNPNDHREGKKLTKTRHATKTTVVRSTSKVYPHIITVTEFKRVEELLNAKTTLTQPRRKAVQRTVDSEPLRGRIFHQGQKLTLDKTRHGKVRYRSNRMADGEPRVAVYDWQVREAVHWWLSENLSRRNLPLLIKQLKSSAPSASKTREPRSFSQRRSSSTKSNAATLTMTASSSPATTSAWPKPRTLNHNSKRWRPRTSTSTASWS
jgi:hypothetical protein